MTDRWCWFGILALTASVLASCAAPAASASPEGRSLTIFAAASLRDAFTEIGEAFEAENRGVTVRFNFANSQALQIQIEEGAMADVFASANTREMDALTAEGMVEEATPFVTNRLTIIAPADNPAGLSDPEDLARAGLKIVLAAEEAPIGMYAREALGRLEALYGSGYQDAVMANVVSNEDNVKQVVAKVQLGEADAGIVYMTDVVAAPELLSIKIPAGQNAIAVYPIAVLRNSREPALAEDFLDYVLSEAGQEVLLAWGFSLPG